MKSLLSFDDEGQQSHVPCRRRVLISSRKRKSSGGVRNGKKQCSRPDAEIAPLSLSSCKEGNMNEPSIDIVTQPEKYFRARYTSEGSRGPMRGDNDGAYPAIQICGYAGPAIVDVYLSRLDGEAHDNVLVLGTNSNGAGEVVAVDGGLQCIRVHTSTASSMEAVFSNVSVRRLRKFEIEAALKERGLDAECHECDRSVACLKFVAHIPGHEDLSVVSNPFQCSSQPGAPEILLVCPNTGTAAGGDTITLVGRRFKSGFKIRFFASTDQGHWEAWSSVDRDLSNQGAAVIKVPKYGEGEVYMATKVQIEVRIGPEKEPYISEPAEFTYLPPSAIKSPCNSCGQTPPASFPMTPTSQKLRAESCSPAPVTASSSTESSVRRQSSTGSCTGSLHVSDMLTQELLESLTNSRGMSKLFTSTPAFVSAEPNLFPSNASSVSDTYPVLSSNALTIAAEPDLFPSNLSSVSVAAEPDLFPSNVSNASVGVELDRFPSNASSASVVTSCPATRRTSVATPYMDHDPFPSGASNASNCSLLSDMAAWPSDLSLLTGEQALDFSLPPAAFEFPDLGEEQDWKVICQVVSEFAEGFLGPGVSNTVVHQLQSLVVQRCPLLHNIYRNCCRKALELPNTKPSYLMKRQLNIYMPLLHGQ